VMLYELTGQQLVVVRLVHNRSDWQAMP
jgi:hypothetical protein